MEKVVKHERINDRKPATQEAIWTLLGITIFMISITICGILLFITNLRAL